MAATADVKGRLVLEGSNDSHKELLVQQEPPKVTQSIRKLLGPPRSTLQGLQDNRWLVFLEEVEVDITGQVSEREVMTHLVTRCLLNLSVELCKTYTSVERQREAERRGGREGGRGES